MYKNTFKTISCGVILLLLFFANVIFAQKIKPENRKKIISQIEKEKNTYYSKTVFNCSVNELKEGIKKYFENKIDFSYNYDTYNRVCYTTYYTRKVGEYVVCRYSNSVINKTPNEPALCYSSYSQRVKYVLYFDIISEGDSLLEVQVDEKAVYIDRLNANIIRDSFSYRNLMFFLNEKIYGKWQPSKELQLKIDRYNNSAYRAKRKIIEGKEY